jgi:hypothetical protein
VLGKILMALTARLPDAFAILDADLAAVIFNQAGPLQFLRDGADAGSTHAHHLREEFLCERKIVARKGLHSRQPFARALANLMHGIAGSGLLRLREDEKLIPDERLPQSRKLQSEIAQFLDLDRRGIARDLNGHAVQGDLVIQSWACTETPVATDNARLDGSAARKFDDKRENPCMRKQNPMNRFMGLDKRLAALHQQNGQVRLNSGKVLI